MTPEEAVHGLNGRECDENGVLMVSLEIGSMPYACTGQRGPAREESRGAFYAYKELRAAGAPSAQSGVDARDAGGGGM